jgi:hypothetical protein
MCDLCRVHRSCPASCMGEGGVFHPVEKERWDRDLGRPTDADITLRHRQIRQEAEMRHKLYIACVQGLLRQAHCSWLVDRVR